MDDKTRGLLVSRLADLIRESSRSVALTGAGVSTDSGIPDFRSAGEGLWTQVDFMKVASIQGLRSDPAAFYEFWQWRFSVLQTCEPNITHMVLAQLEALGLLRSVVTQNIDSLHRRAGSKRVLEVHGNYDTAHCLDCDFRCPIEKVFEKIGLDGLAYCDRCEGLLKPAVVLFGESLPMAFVESEQETRSAELMMVFGSSLTVVPVADLVPLAKYSGARLAIVNRDPTPYDGMADLVINDELGPVMAELIEVLGLD